MIAHLSIFVLRNYTLPFNNFNALNIQRFKSLTDIWMKILCSMYKLILSPPLQLKYDTLLDLRICWFSYLTPRDRLEFKLFDLLKKNPQLLIHLLLKNKSNKKIMFHNPEIPEHLSDRSLPNYTSHHAVPVTQSMYHNTHCTRIAIPAEVGIYKWKILRKKRKHAFDQERK